MLLWVFALALVPWSTLHHHEEQEEYCIQKGKVCMHKSHIGNEGHNCLVCSAHFEKDYYIQDFVYQPSLESKPLIKNQPLISASYTALIRLSLRGPPAA